MEIEEFDRQHQEERDRKKAEQEELIADCAALEKFLAADHEGFKVLMKYFERHKTNCHQRVFSRGHLPEDPVARLVDIEVYSLSYLDVKYLIELPDKILTEGKRALEALSVAKRDDLRAEDQEKARQDVLMKR